ncbi:cob(I)yrinic acid a,c-diamide adenosyltransferase [Candidatus Dojkabacteria bacterium]|nr:cob(I)yrinic acid a,c-diamide adenosyltransferase [Candidatus Dojkabacteria bacterium]
MIIVYTCDGKGKTTAAIGTTLRALSNNKPVAIVQFLKDGKSGEIRLLNMLSKVKPFNLLTIFSFGKSSLTDSMKLKGKDFLLMRKALNTASSIIKKKPFLLVLDEILVALRFKLLTEQDIIKLMDNARREKIHLILTGRGASKGIVEKADLVTKMQNTKHPFDKGLKAVKGIDY